MSQNSYGAKYWKQPKCPKNLDCFINYDAYKWWNIIQYLILWAIGVSYSSGVRNLQLRNPQAYFPSGGLGRGFVSLIFFSVSRSHLHSLVLGPFVELFQTLAFFYCHISYSSLRFSCLPLVKIFLDYIVFIWIIQDGNTPLQDR